MSIIQEIFTPIYGKYCWNAMKGYGSFLTFEFGNPSLSVYERKPGPLTHRLVTVHGEWHLWIYLCDWTVFLDGYKLANSDSTYKGIRRAMIALNGQALTGVQVGENAQTTFTFDLGGRLETRPNVKAYKKDSKQWLLYETSGMVFALRADMKYSHIPGNTSKDEESWIPLFSNHLNEAES